MRFERVIPTVLVAMLVSQLVSSLATQANRDEAIMLYKLPFMHPNTRH